MIVRPSGEMSSDIQVPRLARKRTVRVGRSGKLSECAEDRAASNPTNLARGPGGDAAIPPISAATVTHRLARIPTGTRPGGDVVASP